MAIDPFLLLGAVVPAAVLVPLRLRGLVGPSLFPAALGGTAMGVAAGLALAGGGHV